MIFEWNFMLLCLLFFLGEIFFLRFARSFVSSISLFAIYFGIDAGFISFMPPIHANYAPFLIRISVGGTKKNQNNTMCVHIELVLSVLWHVMAVLAKAAKIILKRLHLTFYASKSTIFTILLLRFLLYMYVMYFVYFSRTENNRRFIAACLPFSSGCESDVDVKVNVYTIYTCVSISI